MEQFLNRAEILLQDVIQSRDVSTLVVLHHLRDLAEVLDNLKLYDECRLTGNCALDLAEALGRRSIEFRHEQAETLALVAGLSVYQPRARTLFFFFFFFLGGKEGNVLVLSSSKLSPFVRKWWRMMPHIQIKPSSLLSWIEQAWADDHPELCVLWPGDALRLITNELPSTMVTAHFCSVVYNNYATSLSHLEQYAKSIPAYQEAISIRRILAKDDPARYTCYLAQALRNMGVALCSLKNYDDACYIQGSH